MNMRLVFANALITGDVSQLPNSLKQQALATRADYLQILDALLNQELGEDAAIFTDGNTAGERLRSGFGACGMKLRSSNTGITGTRAILEGEVLNTLNTLLEDPDSAEQLKNDYGLTESQIRHLRSGQPFQSKEEFMNYVNQDGSGINGYAIWSKFGTFSSTSPPPTDIQS